MDSQPEPKPENETESTVESSDNFTLTNVLPSFIEKNEAMEFLSVNGEPESDCSENKEKENLESVYKMLEHSDSKRKEKQNEVVEVKKIKVSAENNSEKKCLENGSEENEMGNDFHPHISNQDDVSRDSLSASSSGSSGIEKDLELLEDSIDAITENKEDLEDNVLEDSSTNRCRNLKGSNLGSNNSCKKVSENSVCEEKKEEILNLIHNENNIKKEEGIVSVSSKTAIFNAIKFPYKDPENAFKVVVPLIGKSAFPVEDIKPSPLQYNLASEINRLKGLEDAPFMPKLSYHEWRKQRDARSQEEKEREEKKEKYIAAEIALDILKISIIILQEMQKDNPNEKIIEKCFLKFLHLPVSPLSLLLSSPFVHTMMFIRGSSDFSQSLRSAADRCYFKCHVMFPIPMGYNFATVYTSEVLKNIPESLNGMRNFVLDYGDFEIVHSDSDDSAFSDSDTKEKA